MIAARFGWLVVRSLWELARYDVVHAVCGFSANMAPLRKQTQGRVPETGREDDVCRAMLAALCLYWKPVLCLQRSVCTTRLLRAHGVPARLVVGFRRAPFVSHAWVEVRGRVVNDSSTYQKRLSTLYTA